MSDRCPYCFSDINTAGGCTNPTCNKGVVTATYQTQQSDWVMDRTPEILEKLDRIIALLEDDDE